MAAQKIANDDFYRVVPLTPQLLAALLVQLWPGSG